MEDVLNNFFANMAKTQQFLNEPHRLASIWLTKPVLTSNGRTIRITDGDQVKVDKGALVDCNDLPTHEVLECWGASNHSFSLKLRNLETDNEITINL